MAVGSKSFYAASRLFPARLRGAATIIYTYCRLADDLIDKGGTKTLESLRKRLIEFIMENRLMRLIGSLQK